MDVQRLIALNRYTRRDILELTGKEVECSVVCVGNILKRRQITTDIEERFTIAIEAPPLSGKYTAVIKALDILGLAHEDSFDGQLFGELPFIDDETVFIIRNPKKVKLMDLYIKRRCRIVMLFDGECPYKNIPTIKLVKASDEDQARFERLKGLPFPHLTPYIPKKVRDEMLVAKSLKRKGITIEQMPKDTHRWIARNMPTTGILRICDVAQRIKDPVIYHALMSVIKHKRAIKLKYPRWVK